MINKCIFKNTLLKKRLGKCLLTSVIFGISLVAFSGCGETPSSEVTTESVVMKAGTIQLYHATDSGVVADSQRYQLMQPDNLAAALEEVIEQLTLSDKLTIDKYLIVESQNVTLFVTVKEGITEEELLLNRAAIVRSISGLEVGDVAIVMTNEAGEEIERATYTDASFYYYDE